MKLSAVLVLCCSFFCSRASPLQTEDADCDDPDVFEAVDIALRKYNRDKTDGNQFALYVIKEAQRTVGPGKQFFVTYEIRESSCAVGEDKLWQDCDYRASAQAESGECTAQVYVDKTEKISNVTQECKIIPVHGTVILSNVPCLGCYHPIPGDSLQLLPIVRYTIRIFNNESDLSSLFEVGEIIRASRQVVAGWNYAIDYEIKETNCTKNNFQDLSPECKPIAGGHIGRCETKVYVDISDTIGDVGQKCKFPVKETVSPPLFVCAGCPRPISVNSPELEEPLKASLEKYNEESNDDFYYKADAIFYATVQVVAGKNYNITFSIRKTNCSKTDVKKLNEDCAARPDSTPLQCIAQVYVIPWENKIHPKVRCIKEEIKLMRRPPGLTPFRSLYQDALAQHIPQNKKEKGPTEGQTPDKGSEKDIMHKPAHEQGHRHDLQCGPKHGHGHEEEHRRKHDIRCGPEHEDKDKHGHGLGHGKHKDKQKKIKDKHKHSKDDSSEESHEKVTNQTETLLAEVAEIPEGTQSSKPDLVELDVLSTTQQSTTDPTDFPREIPDLPSEPDSPGIIPDIPLFEGLPDLPEPSVPKCPGKPWKKIRDFSTTNEPKVLTNEDTNPVTETYTPTPKALDGFKLTDALL